MRNIEIEWISRGSFVYRPYWTKPIHYPVLVDRVGQNNIVILLVGSVVDVLRFSKLGGGG